MPRTRRNLISPLYLAFRNLRSGGAAPLVFVSVVLLAAFIVSATPRFINAASDEALRTAAREALPINRNVIFQRAVRLAPSQGEVDPLAPVREAGDDLREELPESVRQVIFDERFVVDSALFEVWSLPDDGAPAAYRFFRFRHQDGVEDHIAVVEGRLPQPADPVILEGADGLVETPKYETAISTETAELFQLGAGDRVLLIPRIDDSLNLGIPLSQLSFRLVLEISGIFEIPEPGAEFWFADRYEPSMVENPSTPDSFLFFGMGLLDQQDYARFMADVRPSRLNYEWRFFVDPDRLDTAGLDQLTGEIQEMEFLYPGRGPAGSIWMNTGLGQIADDYRGRRRLTVTLVSVIVVGLAALVSAVGLLLAALRANRLRDVSNLARSRGASIRQLGWSHFAESLVLFIPAALAGYGLAVLLIRGREGPSIWPASLVVALVFSAFTVALVLPTFFGGSNGRQLGSGRPSGRRMVVEALIVTGAVVGLVLLRRRGLEAGAEADTAEGVDLFLAAVPVLLGLAFGIALLRLYPSLVALAGWLGALRPGVIEFVGLRRIARQPAPARLPMLVMLLAVGIAVFGSVLVHSITEGQLNSASQQVGADYRIESLRDGAPVSRLVDLSDVEPIEAMAEVSEFDARLTGLDFARGIISLVALELTDYQAVVEGTRADPNLPAAIAVDQNPDGLGTPDNPIVAAVSSNWPGDSAPDVGDTLMLNVGREDVTIEVVEVRASLPGLEEGQPFVVLSRSSLADAGPTLDFRATRRYVRAPSEAAAELRQALRTQSPDTVLVSRAEVLGELAEAPLVDAVKRGTQIAVVIAAVLAVLAATAGIALTAAERGRDLGYLRTIGLSPRGVVRLTIIEQVPPAILATGGGVALGLMLAWLTSPGLDLTPFAGRSTILTVDVGSLLLIAIGLLVCVLGATSIYSYLTRRMNLGDVLRLGDRL